jgi:hypothetical protein
MDLIYPFKHTAKDRNVSRVLSYLAFNPRGLAYRHARLYRVFGPLRLFGFKWLARNNVGSVNVRFDCAVLFPVRNPQRHLNGHRFISRQVQHIEGLQQSTVMGTISLISSLSIEKNILGAPTQLQHLDFYASLALRLGNVRFRIALYL